MAYGEVLFTLTGLQVAAWDGSNYGTPVVVGHKSKIEIEPQFDTDQIKSGGVMVELLSVVTHVTFTMEFAKLESGLMDVISNDTVASSGTTPNQATTFGPAGGGSGMPKFCVIGSFASEDAGNMLVGVPLCKIEGYPTPTQDQNNFAVYSVNGTGIANAAASAATQILYYAQNETAAALPANSAAVDTFFGIS